MVVLAHQDRLEHALVADRCDEIGEVAHIRSRLIRIRAQAGQRQKAPDSRFVATRQLVDEMGAVAHLDPQREASLGRRSGFRHG
jgi:hypothetical protein